jgi:hypothetical protein
MMGEVTRRTVSMSLKKTELKLGAVKLEVTLITRAKLIAAGQGKPLAGYLSESLRPIIDRDWAKMLRTADKGGDGVK